MSLDLKRYRCICQKSSINSPNLKKHLLKPMYHELKLIKSKCPNKDNLQDEYDKIKSLKILFEKYSNQLTYHTITKCSKPSINISLAQSLLSNRIQTENKNFLHLASQSKNYYFDNKKLQKLTLTTNNLYIKEITPFKNLKKIIKANFKQFIKTHTTTITNLMSSPNLEYLISGGLDGIVRLWNPNTLTLIKSFSFHKSWIYAIEIDPLSNYCLTGSEDSQICMWDLKKLQLDTCFQSHKKPIRDLKFLKTSTIFASASEDKSIKIFNIFSKTLIFDINFDSSLIRMELIRKGRQLLYCCENRTVGKFDLNLRNIICKSIISRKILGMAYSGKANFLIFGLYDGFIEIINSNTLKLIKTFKGHPGNVLYIDVSESLNMFGSSSVGFKLCVWQLYSFRMLYSFSDFKFNVRAICFAAERLYLAANDPAIQGFNMKSLICINKTSIREFSNSNLSVSINNKILAYGKYNLRFYCLETGDEMLSSSIVDEVCTFSFCGSILICASTKGEIYYIDYDNLDIKRKFYLVKSQIYFIRSSIDYSVLAYSTENKYFLLDFNKKAVVFSFNDKIHNGRFIEKRNMFVYVSRFFGLYILKDYCTLIKIKDYYQGLQIYTDSYQECLIVKSFLNKFYSLNLMTGKEEIIERLRDVKSRSLKYSKKNLITSCLNYTEKL